jgi:hypothetical protein
MSDSRGWAALGIASWVVAFAGFAIHGYPAANASPRQLAEWSARTDATRFDVGISVEAAGLLLFLFFVAWLCHVLRRSGAPPWLLALALVATGLWAAGGVLTNGIWTALLDAGKRGLDPGILSGLHDVAQEAFNADNVLLAPGLAALGLAAAQTAALPRWLSWALFVIGILMLLPPLALPLQIVFVLWVATVSALFLVRPLPARADTTTMGGAGPSPTTSV